MKEMEVYQDHSGGSLSFPKPRKPSLPADVNMGRLVQSQYSHSHSQLIGGNSPSSPLSTLSPGISAAEKRKEFAARVNAALGSPKRSHESSTKTQSQTMAAFDRSFSLQLDHETVSSLVDSKEKTIEFEIPAANHPRLSTPFYTQLRKKYPRAFIRQASLGSMFSDSDSEVQRKPGLPPKPRKIHDFSIRGCAKRKTSLQTASHYSSMVSLNSDSPLKRSDSRLSLKERLQQNQDQWRKLTSPNLSPFRRRASHSQVESPSQLFSDCVSPNLSGNDAQQKAEGENRGRRFASPDSSHDSAVDMDSASIHSSPLSDKNDPADRASRQTSRSVIPAKDRPPRSRTPKLKAARNSVPSSPSTKAPNVTESDADSGIAAPHWASNTSQMNTRFNPIEDGCNENRAISPKGSMHIRSSLDLLDNADVKSSAEKVKFADDQIDPLNTSERYLTDDSSSVVSGQESKSPSAFKPVGSFESLPAKKPPKGKSKPASTPKPSLSKSKSKHRDGTEFDMAMCAGNITPKAKKKKSFLPWKKNKGRYTPSKEVESPSPAISEPSPAGSPASIRSFATVNSRPKRPSSVIESIAIDETDAHNDSIECPDDMDHSFGSDFDDDDEYYPDDYIDSHIQSTDSQFGDDVSVGTSNLQQCKDLSGSRTSLKDQFGNWKENAKQKMGKLRRAMSAEKMDKEEEVKAKEKKSKMKKAPSLQNLFRGRRGSKDGRNGSKPPSGSQSSFRASKRSLTKQDIETDPSKFPQHARSIGKLKHVNEDDTQVIELFRPKHGPMGFYVAKGNAEYNHGFFVSRLSDALPEHFFAGILSIGDEILEINGRKVVDMPLEGVYDLLGHGDTVLLRTLPYSARAGSKLI